MRLSNQIILISFFTISSMVLFSIPSASAAQDMDQDGLVDSLEIQLGTDPAVADTDGDGYADGLEVANGYNPLLGKSNRAVKRTATVDLSKQQMYYYFNNVKIGTIPVSTGVIGLDTPTGEYQILRKVPIKKYAGANYSYPNTKWNLEFKKSYYLHGAYWHNQFGIKPMSHGCVNIGYAGAEKIYKFLSVGDKIKIVGKTPVKKLAANQ